MRVYIHVIGNDNDKLPYGTAGQRKHKGPKRSIVDFGKLGKYRVPNSWLSETKPEPKSKEFIKGIQEALSIVDDMFK